MAADVARQLVTARLRVADTGTAPDVATPGTQSGLVSALRGYPRFGATRELALTSDYIGGVVSVAVPWLAVALTCLVIAFCTNLCCGTLRRRKGSARLKEGFEEALKAQQKKRDDNAAKPGHHAEADKDYGDSSSAAVSVEHWPAENTGMDNQDAQRKDPETFFAGFRSSRSSSGSSSSVSVMEVSQLIWGVILFNLSFSLVGIALIANFTFREGIVDVLDSIRYLKTRTAAPVALATFFESLVQRAATSSLSSLLSNISDSFKDVITLQQQLHAFVSSVQPMLTKADTLLRTANRVGLIVFVVLALFILMLLMGLFLLFLVQSGRRGKAGLARFLLIAPVTLSWFGAGVITVAAVFAGDACVLVDRFQRLIIVQAGLGNSSLTAGINPDTNALFSNGIKCPRSTIDPSVLSSIEPLLNLNQTSSSGVIDGLVGYLFPGEQTRGVGQYAVNVYDDIMHCESLARFAAKLNSTACGQRGPILALFALWIGVIILAVVLTVFFFVAQYSTFDTTRFYTPRIFADVPKEFVIKEDPLEDFPKHSEQ